MSTIETLVFGPLMSPFRQGNVAMFHIGRSGSTVIADLLDQDPNVFWDGEVYEKLIKKKNDKLSPAERNTSLPDPLRVLPSRMRRAGKKFYGFEIKFFHLPFIDLELSELIEQLEALGFTHYIILERKNYLRKIVSSLIAHETSRWHQIQAEKATLTRIKIDVNSVKIDRDARPLMSYLRDWDDSFRKLESILDGRKVLPLTYEDDISTDPLTAYRRVCDFLDIEYRQGSIRYGKTNPFTLNEIIINFKDVKQVLQGTHFEWMLYE